MRKKTRVKVPTIIQMEATECGAASLAMVLAYYGKYVPLEQMRIDCGVSRDGSNAANLVKAANAYGLEAKGGFYTSDGLKEVAYPAILFWNQSHFVVLEGVKGDTFYLNDPGMGPRKLTQAEFEKGFSRLCLRFEKAPEFQPGGEKPKDLQLLWPLLNSIKKPMLLCLFVNVLLLIPGISLPAFSQIFIDDYLIGHYTSWLNPLILTMLIVLVVQVGLVYSQQTILQRLEVWLASGMNNRFAAHLLRLPCQFFSQRSPGNLISRLQSNTTVAQFVTYNLLDMATSLIQVAAYALVMIFYSTQLFLALLLLSALEIILYFYTKHATKNRYQAILTEQGKLFGTVMGGMSLLETIKACAAEHAFIYKWLGYLSRYLNSSQSLMVLQGTLQTCLSVLTQLRTVLILGIGGFLVVYGHLSVGGLIAFNTLSIALSAALQKLLDNSNQFQSVKANLRRLEDVYRYQEDVRYQGTFQPPEALKGHVQFQQFCFGYAPKSPPLIRDFELEIQPGQQVAVVGLSGSGKSTLAKCLSGLYQPWSGQILLDGKPLSAYDPAVLSETIASVDQEIVLFEGSLRDNLTLWREDYTDQQLMQALELACLAEEIRRRPDGLDTEVKEGGRNFSGGQRQRLEIARALLKSPKVLILDEATSALDPLIEVKIMTRLRAMGCTTFTIAHRLSTVKEADHILVFDKGHAVEQGTHSELLASQGVYWKMMTTEGAP